MICEYIAIFRSFCLRHLLRYGLLLALGLYSFVGYAGDLLSDDELAIVSAGSPGPIPDPTADRATIIDDLTVVGDPGLRQWGNIERQGDLTFDEDSHPVNENVIVLAGSSANVKRRSQINLSRVSQSNLNALNLSNTSRSNVINGLNINTNNQPARTMQNNRFEQKEFNQAGYATNSDFLLIRRVSSRNESITSQAVRETSAIQTDIISRQVLSYSHVDGSVEPFKPEVVFNVESIQASPSEPITLIAPVHRSFSATDSDGDAWSLYGDYSGLSITPIFNVNGLEPRGEDLFLDIELGLPGVDMGTISASGCIGSCGEDSTIEFFSVDLGSIERTNIIDGITFREMNPLSGLELNINSGIAYSGQGRLSASESGVGIDGQLTAHIGANYDFTLDLSDSWWVDNLYRNNGTWNVHRERDYDVLIPFTILDYQVDAFEVEFGGSVCMDLGSLFGCSDNVQEYEYQEIWYSDHSAVFIQAEERIFSNIINESTGYEEIRGGILTDARADLIVMTASDLQLASDSDVNINDSAQRNLEAVNVVNSAAAISANSLNLNVGRPVPGTLPKGAGALLSQGNYFNQRL